MNRQADGATRRRLRLPTGAEVAEALRAVRAAPWGLWRRQALAVAALERRKMFSGRRAALPAFLALAPVGLFALRYGIVSAFGGGPVSVPIASKAFAEFFQMAQMRLVIFFGCVAAFTTLFRGEVQERTLHYYLLSPVRRDVIVAGKYLAGVAATVLLFCSSTAASYALNFIVFGRAGLTEHLQNEGFRHLAAYLLVSALGCVGYGAVFLALGLLQRNAVVTSVGVLAWESFNFLLPPLVKKISIVYYLQSLCPVPVNEGPLALVSQPATPALAVPCLLVVSSALLVLAAWRLRRVEVLYTGE